MILLAESATITVPVITSASIVSNPANINAGIVIFVRTDEESRTIYGEERYSGEFAAGEV